MPITPIADQKSVGDSRHSTFFQSSRFVVTVLLFFTGISYAGALRFNFVWDDWTQIVYNPRLTSASYIPQFFTEHVWAHLAQYGTYYRPLYLLWLYFNRQIFGLSATGWHLAAIIAHLAACGLVYLLVRRVSKDAFIAIVACGVFALHPTHVESVAWISGATDSLMTVGVVAAFICWLRYYEEPGKNRGLLIISLGAYAAAILIKETALILPGIVFAYSYFNDVMNRSLSKVKGLSRALGVSLPFLGMSAVYYLIRISVLKNTPSIQPQSLTTTLISAPSILWFYLKHLLWPVRLSCFYDVGFTSGITLHGFVLPAAILLITAVLLVVISRTSFFVALATAWLVLPLVPVLVGMRTFDKADLVHDRYLYVSCVGFAMLIAIGIKKLKINSSVAFGRPAIQVEAVILIVICFAILTIREAYYWSNDLVLYTRAVQVAPRSGFAYDHLANELYKRGNVDGALGTYEKALSLDPTDWRASLAVGLIAYRTNRFDTAEQYLSRSLAADPTQTAAYYYQAMSYLNLGKLQQAQESVERGLKYWPSQRGFHALMGRILARQGKIEAARSEYSIEIKYYPDSLEARQGLAELK